LIALNTALTIALSMLLYTILVAVSGSSQAGGSVEVVKLEWVGCEDGVVRVRVVNVGGERVTLKSLSVLDRGSGGPLCSYTQLEELEAGSSREIAIHGCTLGGGMYEVRAETTSGQLSTLVLAGVSCR